MRTEIGTANHAPSSQKKLGACFLSPHRYLSIRLGAVLLHTLVALSMARADIAQSQHDGFISLEGTRGLGQTFTADASVQNLELIQWWYESANFSLPPANVMVSLYQGDPLSGILLRQVPMSFGESMESQWVGVDFAGTTLSPGGMYSFTVLGASGSMEGGVGYSVDMYSGGIRYEFIGGHFSPTAQPNTDMSFRVIGIVPEPSVSLLFGAGILGLLHHAWLRKSRRVPTLLRRRSLKLTRLGIK